MGKIRPKYDGCLLSCVIAADTHIDMTEHPMPWLPPMLLRRVLSDSSRAKRTQDAFVIIGDATSHGIDKNWDKVEETFRRFPAPAKNILIALGNHDTWDGEKYETAVERYYKSAEKICGVKREKPYFSADINGYKFIVLGAADDGGRYTFLGEEQLAWLENELKQGSEGNRPVFVFNHESLNGRHGLPQSGDANPAENLDPMDSGIGPESERVEELLKKYGRVFFFSGHSHMGFCGEKMKEEKGYSSFEQEDRLTLVNLPSIACGNHSGEDNRNCAGVVLEIYADRVLLRIRDFRFRCFVEKLPLKDGRGYYEIEL